VKPKTQIRTLDLTGLSKPRKTCGLTGTGSGLVRQESAGRVVECVWNWTNQFLRSKPGLLACYLEQLLTLDITSDEHRKILLKIQSRHPSQLCLYATSSNILCMCSMKLTQSQYAQQQIVRKLSDLIIYYNGQGVTHIHLILLYLASIEGIRWELHR